MAEAASDIDLDSAALDELNNQEAKALLDTIDNLRALDVGEIVHLPQIIVVGDQSSGKSSVLEAISHVRFPVKGDVCTRFATELVLRKAPELNVDVSIRFSGSGSAANRSSEPFRKAGFGRDDLPRLIDEATEKMGVRSGTTNDFSKDVLHVEVTGPDVPSLTLVDLPGFFHSATADQSLQGKITVDELAKGYMKQNNSIILAVVAANAQLAGQIVLDKCLENDPTRARTMGVVTKPDLAPAGSDNERKYLQLAQNKESHHKLALGWHVLRNGSVNDQYASDDDPAKERDEKETKFLSSGSWAELAPGNKGIASLRRKLGKVLLDHIRETLPGVIDEIGSSLDGRVTKLNQLGQARSTIQDMKTYLINIAEDFQRLVRDGASGIYSDGFFGDLGDTERKLRANLRNLNRAFDITLLTKGASRKIQPSNDESDKDRGNSRAMAADVPDYLHPFMSCYNFNDPEEVSEADVCKELESWAAANQGKEFPGVPNKDLVIQLFQAQAHPWRAISQRHINLATDVVKEFMENLVAHVVGEDKATALAILRNCIDPFFDERTRVLAAKLEELLAPYEKGYGIPLGGEYQSSLSKMTLTRLAGQVSGILLDEFSEGNKATLEKISDAIVSADELRRGDFGTETIVDMMEAYYEVRVATRFVVNTVLNAA
ncbi:dynamin family protein [Candidatus Bathyarchaeota archaeon]|nr:dynamin family protein [Candidatus Bathyarchaeota archaeon]